ncbi:MAG: TlpA disulfide reductase family protein [Ginsengibacter sp.]
MKNILVIILLLPAFVFAQKGYKVTGHIYGSPDGMKVYMKSEGISKKPVDDSTTIKNGVFKFSGMLEAPVLVKLILDKTPKGEKSSASTWLASNFYLDNSDITYTGKLDSLPTYYYKRNAISVPPTVKGSPAQDESVKFNEDVIGLKKELAKTDEEYMNVYHLPAMEGTFHTAEGIALANKYNDLSEKILNNTMDYIHKNPKSIIAFDQAYYAMEGYTTTLSIPQIDDLVNTIKSGWEGTYNMNVLMDASTHARKTAIGIKYQDFEFTTPEGKKVMLSTYVPKGKIVMLEFWASWCGPCRAEIPHLKHLNETKSDEFSIVSISLDENDASWKKAMKDEGMVWTQVVDYKGFEGEISKAYNIVGIPHSLILDREGRIMKVGLRGAFLDAYLEKMKAENK